MNQAKVGVRELGTFRLVNFEILNAKQRELLTLIRDELDYPSTSEFSPLARARISDFTHENREELSRTGTNGKGDLPEFFYGLESIGSYNAKAALYSVRMLLGDVAASVEMAEQVRIANEKYSARLVGREQERARIQQTLAEVAPGLKATFL